jgi:clan AA aspartic protease
MGTFYMTILVGNPDGGDLTPVNALVDTGASDSMFPCSLLERLQIEPFQRRICKMADGREEEYGRAIVSIGIGDLRLPCPALMGPDDTYLLGATTLEIFDLSVDPLKQGLIERVRIARPF